MTANYPLLVRTHASHKESMLCTQVRRAREMPLVFDVQECWSLISVFDKN